MLRSVSVPLGRKAPRDSRTLPLGRVYCAFADYGDIQALCWRAKSDRRAADRLATLVADRFCAEWSGPSFALVTSVPGSPDRVKARGYDIPSLIALEVVERLGGVYWPLLASIPHVRQSRQSINDRWLSASRSYMVPKSAGLFLRMAAWAGDVLLVDDVCSSGATIAACMSALRSECVSREVVGLVAGHPALRAGVWRQFGVDW